MCVCVGVYTCVYACTYTCVCTCVYKYTYMGVVCIHACVHTHIGTRSRLYTEKCYPIHSCIKVKMSFIMENRCFKPR